MRFWVGLAAIAALAATAQAEDTLYLSCSCDSYVDWPIKPGGQMINLTSECSQDTNTIVIDLERHALKAVKPMTQIMDWAGDIEGTATAEISPISITANGYSNHDSPVKWEISIDRSTGRYVWHAIRSLWDQKISGLCHKAPAPQF